MCTPAVGRTNAGIHGRAHSTLTRCKPTPPTKTTCIAVVTAQARAPPAAALPCTRHRMHAQGPCNVGAERDPSGGSQPIRRLPRDGGLRNAHKALRAFAPAFARRRRCFRGSHDSTAHTAMFSLLHAPLGAVVQVRRVEHFCERVAQLVRPSHPSAVPWNRKSCCGPLPIRGGDHAAHLHVRPQLVREVCLWHRQNLSRDVRSVQFSCRLASKHVHRPRLPQVPLVRRVVCPSMARHWAHLGAVPRGLVVSLRCRTAGPSVRCSAVSNGPVVASNHAVRS